MKFNNEIPVCQLTTVTIDINVFNLGADKPEGSVVSDGTVFVEAWFCNRLKRRADCAFRIRFYP